MRVLPHSSNYSQKTILAQKGLTLRSFVATKLKKTTEQEKTELKINVKATSKYEDENNFHTESVRKSTILNESKKIQKSTFKKKPFTELTNPTPAPIRTLRSGKVFLEDGTKQTKNYEKVQLTDARTKKKLNFLCFPERDLAVTASFAGKVVQHSCDNDCSTDEEQIETAISDLFKSLQECVKEENLKRSTSKKQKRSR